MPENDTFSFERLLGYYQLYCEEHVESVENVTNLTDEYIDIEEKRNESKWEESPIIFCTADEDYYEYDLKLQIVDYVFLSNALNDVREIPLVNDFHTGNNEYCTGEENEMKVWNEKFNDDSNTVTEQLSDIKKKTTQVINRVY